MPSQQARHECFPKATHLSLCLFVAVLTLMCVLPFPLRANPLNSPPTTNKAIGVAFYGSQGLHQRNDRGEFSGYDVDFLKQLPLPQNRPLLFIPTTNKAEALELLRQKKVDVVGGMLAHHALQKEFRYSAISAGSTWLALMGSAHNPDLIYEDFKNFGRLRIGVSKDFERKQRFRAYAAKQGFEPHFVDFESCEAAQQAVQDGTIDAYLGTVMDMGEKEKILARFGAEPFFHITRAEDESLMNLLEKSITQIRMSTPELESQLMRTYFSRSEYVPMSKAELDWLLQAPPLRVGFFPHRKPLSYQKDDSKLSHGILPELMRLLGRITGLRFHMVPLTDPELSPADYIAKGKVDMVVGLRNNAVNRAETVFALTEPILRSNMALYGKSNAHLSPEGKHKVVLPLPWRQDARHITVAYPNYTFTFLEKTEDCFKAVALGQADMFLHNVHAVNHLLLKPLYTGIVPQPFSYAPDDIGIGVGTTNSPLLLSVLNKSLLALKDEEKNRIINDELSQVIAPLTLEDVFYLHGRQIVLGLVLLLSLALILSYNIKQKRKHARKQLESERRFKSITDSIDGGVISLTLDADMTLHHASDGFWHMLGYPPEHMKSSALASYLPPDEMDILQQKVKDCLNTKQLLAMEVRMAHRTRGHIITLLRGTFSPCASGKMRLYCVIKDVTIEKEALARTSLEQARCKALLAQSHEMLFLLDIQSNCYSCTQMCNTKFGWPIQGDFTTEPANSPLQLLPAEEKDTLTHLHHSLCRGEESVAALLRIPNADRRLLWCRLHVAAVGHSQYVGKIVDVDDAVRQSHKKHCQWQLDELTDLLNKKFFESCVTHSLVEDRENGKGSVLMLISIDDFAKLSKSFEQLPGDRMLVAVSETLKNVFPGASILARMDTDLFAVYLQTLPYEGLLEKIQHLRTRLLKLTAEGKTEQKVTASLGIYLFTGEAVSFNEAMLKTEKALQEAKNNGKNSFVFCTSE